MRFLILLSLFPFLFYAQSKYDKDVESLGNLYDAHQFDQTIKSCSEYLGKHETKMDSYNKSLLHTYIGLSYLNKQDHTNAEQFLKQSVRDLADSTEETRYQHAQNKYYLATLYNLQGRYYEADPLYRQALPLLAIAYGQYSEKYCSYFREYAQMMVEMGRYSEAYPMINAALEFYRVLKGEKDKDFIGLLNDMGRIHQAVGNYQYASLYFDSALVLHKTHISDRNENFTVMVGNAGENYRLMADYDLAEQYMLEAIRMADSFPSTRASSLNNLGLVYTSRGMFVEAERSFNEALSIYSAENKSNTLDAGFPWNGLGNVYRVTGRYKQAIAAFQKVVSIRESLGAINEVPYANVLTNIALTYSDFGYNDEALQYLEAAHKIYLSVVGEKHPNTANCIYNKGAIKERKNDLVSAEQLKLQAIELYKEILGEKSERYAVFLMGMAPLYSKKKEPEKAIEFLDKAEKIMRENLGGKNYNYYDILFNKAQMYRELNKYESSTELFISAINGYKDLLRDFFPYMNEDEKMQIHSSMTDRFETFYDYVSTVKQKNISKADPARLNASLYDFQLFNKSSLLNESVELRRNVYASGDVKLIDRYEYLLELRKYIGNRYRLSPEQLAASGIQVDSLETEAGKIEKEIYTALKKSGAEVNRGWKEIAAKLDKSSAAVEIVRTALWINDTIPSVSYAALIVRNNSKQPELILLDDGNKMDGEWAAEYRKNILDRTPDLKSWERYWKKLHAALKGTKNIYFSGDGVYLQLSLNSLYNPGSKKFLIEETDIHLVTNTKDILQSKQQLRTNKNASFFGYPDYEYDFITKRKIKETTGEALATRFGFYELTPLPGTKKEVKEISKVFSDAGYNTTTFLETDADEKNLKAVKSPFVLHIATHGFFLPDEVMHDKKIIGFTAERIQENPLLRSGIIMAGASAVARDTAILTTEDEDGILTAYEASFMNLQETELVVLSACQTGLGTTVNGQGVYGLQRSFLIAGARSLLMSMWIVDDYATQELMLEFYREWLKDPTPAGKFNAFKKAQQKVKEKYKDPFYWAAFVLLEK